MNNMLIDLGNNIYFIFMGDQYLPPPLNNMLGGVITLTLSSWGIKICHPPLNNMFIDLGNNINFIFIATWSQTRSKVRVAAYMFIHVYTCLCLRTENWGRETLLFRVGGSWCYADDGVGGVGWVMLTFVWTCWGSWCYADDGVGWGGVGHVNVRVNLLRFLMLRWWWGGVGWGGAC